MEIHLLNDGVTHSPVGSQAAHSERSGAELRGENPAEFPPKHWPEILHIEQNAVDDPLSKKILSRLNGSAKIQIVGSPSDPLSGETSSSKFQVGEKGDADSGDRSERPSDLETDSVRFTRGKRQLFLRRHLGSWLKSCPGTSQHVCCNLWIVNPGEGCPLDCTYCYLQSYLRRNPTLKLYTNTGDMLSEIERLTSREPSRLFRIGTGEVIDSLVWDDLTDQTTELVPFFARLENSVLELKTKTDRIGNLIELQHQHKGRTVVSWSINAATVSRNDEAHTTPLEQRFAAAATLADLGYRIGLHFDPVVHFPGWQDEYSETIRRVFSLVPHDRIAWVSVSTLRYKREMQEIMRLRFPESTLPLGEQFLAKDDKLRYFQPIRFRLLDFVWSEIKASAPNVPLYMCMESAAAWQKIHGAKPAAGVELREIFGRRRLAVLQE